MKDDRSISRANGSTDPIFQATDREFIHMFPNKGRGVGPAENLDRVQEKKEMKNIQSISRAANCTFPIFQVTDEEFDVIFPKEGQNIEFAEDLRNRLGQEEAARLFEPIWARPIQKCEVNGIHGTLFHDYQDRKKYFPDSKRDADFNPHYLNPAEQRMYAALKGK